MARPSPLQRLLAPAFGFVAPLALLGAVGLSGGRATPPARAPSAAPAPLDFAGADQLPVRTRPTAQETDRLPDNAPLLRAMHADRVLFRRMRYLLPARFRIADAAPRWQAHLDKAVLDIAGTEPGRRAVCPFAADSAADVTMYFQVSTPAAQKIRAACRGFPVPPAVLQRLRVIRAVSPPFQPEPLMPAKKFVLVFSDSGRTEIEGYTTKTNVTYLILSAENHDAESFRRMIAHEIAMSYDQLSRLGYLVNPTTIEDMGVGLAFGKSPMDPLVFAEPSRAELNRMRCAFRDPALRYAASAQRAFRFEDSVSAELGGTSPAAAASGSCAQILAKNSVLLQAMARAVSWDTGWYTAACGIATDPAARVKQIVARIHDVERTTLACHSAADCGGRPTMSLCDLLFQPRLGPNAQDLDGGGPRPRMGGGWDQAPNERQGLLLRAEQGEGLSPSETSELGAALSFPNSDQLDREERGSR